VLDRYAKVYPRIADALARALPAAWTKAWVLAEMDAASGSVVVAYAKAPGEPVGWLEPPLTLYQQFREMNNAARAEGDSPGAWTSVTYVLERNGHFEVEFGYDPIPIEDESERMDAWERRYLPR